ncbi:hypothetical protein ACHHYP_06234 [Achlya hypogyna]|uniref:F-box domain-containing protein n=1 Tax=Achlya hypogyna TaxID=1202772 RepID=A0A1V9YV22_ACHHY|nr:hypothetical protein ACHHYP_06234 [Achlya hypogyna]
MSNNISLKRKEAELRSHDTPTRPKRAHNNIIGDTLTAIVAFLQPQDTLRLSFSCQHFHDAIDSNIWKRVLLTQCNVHPSQFKPRTNIRKMAATLVAKNTNTPSNGCKTVLAHSEHRGTRLCYRCITLPKYQEITHRNAMRRFNLGNKLLWTLKYRCVSTGYRRSSSCKLYNLQDVMDLAARSNRQAT